MIGAHFTRSLLSRLFGRSSIDAGGRGKRWNSNGLRRPNVEILHRAALSGARAAWMVMNFPYARSIVETWVFNLIGDGPALRPVTKDAALKRQLLAVWNRFWRDCDVEGVMQLDGMLQAIARSLVIYGEVLVHMVADRETGSLKLRLWGADQVDRSLNRDLSAGARIVAGIEFDAGGRRVAYHVVENADTPFVPSYTPRRIPAEDVVHLFETIFPGQVRGISWLSPSATRLVEIDKLDDAMLAKFNTAALFGGVFKKPDATDTKILPSGPDGDPSLEPGAMIYAPPGYEVEFSDPPNAEGAVEFRRDQVRAAAAGAGVPYELASGDLSQVSYISGRLGLMEFRRRVIALQKGLIAGRLLGPVWRRLLLLEGLGGRLALSAAMTVEAEFVFTGWAQIEPMKETNADIAAVNAKIKSRFEVIAARGRDPESVDEEIAQDATADTIEEPAA